MGRFPPSSRSAARSCRSRPCPVPSSLRARHRRTGAEWCAAVDYQRGSVLPSSARCPCRQGAPPPPRMASSPTTREARGRRSHTTRRIKRQPVAPRHLSQCHHNAVLAHVAIAASRYANDDTKSPDLGRRVALPPLFSQRRFRLRPSRPTWGCGAHLRLGAALSAIQAVQVDRDKRRLASRTLTIRDKDRICLARGLAGEVLAARRDAATATFGSFLQEFENQQKQKQRAESARARQRRQQAPVSQPRTTLRSTAEPDISTLQAAGHLYFA